MIQTQREFSEGQFQLSPWRSKGLTRKKRFLLVTIAAGMLLTLFYSNVGDQSGSSGGVNAADAADAQAPESNENDNAEIDDRSDSKQ